MGCESSKSETNVSKSDSDYSSNSAKENGRLEMMDNFDENENIMVERVWIVKRSIRLNDEHVFNPLLYFILNHLPFENSPDISFVRPKHNVFTIENKYNNNFKHWAVILELSNKSYVNIQFGSNGFSLKKFNKTNIEGESVLNAIINTWGEDGLPFSFCYLGEANYNYKNLYNILKEKKNQEETKFKEKGKIYYSVLSNNCQHFACDIEKILFGKIKGWHSFNYYLNEFFEHFFPNINIDKLKKKYENDLKKINEELFKSNIKKIKLEELAKSHCKNYIKIYSYIIINGLEKSFGLNINDYLS